MINLVFLNVISRKSDFNSMTFFGLPLDSVYFYLVIKVQLMYSITIVPGVQYDDSIFVYIVK